MSDFKAVKKVLWQVLVLNFLVAGLKIAVGFFTGTVSILADGFHSLMDGSSNIVGLVALRFSEAPPDPEHPYGHRKAETMATLFIGMLLFLVAFEILQSAVERLFSGATPTVTPLSFAVMIVTIGINLGVTLYERRRGRALQSDILLADAAHTFSDVWVSLSVIAGLIGVQLGFPQLDAGVGLVIAVIIGYNAVQVLRQATNVLMDAAVLPSDELARVALTIPEVVSVERIRSRGKPDDTQVDLHVRVKPDTPIDYAHSIAHAVQHRISRAFPQVSDITIHTEPALTDHPDHAEASRQLKAIAHSLGGSAHEIWTHTIDGRFYVELHLEVPPTLTLADAHRLATELETRGQTLFHSIAEITTHIEPLGQTLEHTDLPPGQDNQALITQATAIADDICGPGASHHVYVWPHQNEISLSMHCTLKPDMSIVAAHQVSQQVEAALRRQIPQLSRVTVHVEPPGQKD